MSLAQLILGWVGGGPGGVPHQVFTSGVLFPPYPSVSAGAGGFIRAVSGHGALPASVQVERNRQEPQTGVVTSVSLLPSAGG